MLSTKPSKIKTNHGLAVMKTLLHQKTIVITFWLGFAYTNTVAQHCPFCLSSIYVLNITDADDSNAIDGLTVYFLDANLQPVLHQYFDFESQRIKPDTLFGWQNPKRTTFRGLIDNNNPFDAQKFRFWFAKDGYILQNKEKAKFIVIEDGLKKKLKPHYQQQIISLDSMNLFPLCTGYSHWDLGESYGIPAGFKPTLVKLKRNE